VFESAIQEAEQAQSPSPRLKARTEAILRAALEELAEVGYSGFSYEAVAGRVGVAKTTVYRRYPTKIDLVRAALRHFLDEAAGEVPNTGSLRGDLVALGLKATQIASSVLGQSLFRTRLLDRVAPELDALGAEFERERDSANRAVAVRALARGELSSEADFVTLVQVLSGAILFKLVIKHEAVGELEITHMVDLLLNGVSRPAASATRTRHGL
jgi:AcrR family transcriptional regulator